MEQKNTNSKLIKGLLWKLIERFGVQGVQFVMQILLARLLSPEHYGVLSIMIIFTTLANVFVQTGFNTSLIQGKDVEEEDYSSVFWVTFLAATGLYVALFFAAPVIADFYDMPTIVIPFRVISLILFPGAINSIQLAKVSREMDFKKVFQGNVAGIIISGVVGIVLALNHFGIWALVIQTLLNTAIPCLVMWFTVRWRPKFVCKFERVIKLFSFGWKILASSLLDTLYQDLSSLVIGKKYASGTLGFYNRGKQFPQFIITAVNGTVQSVLLPAMSENQDDKAKVKQIMRNSVTISAYIVFPIMAGLAGVASTMVTILLTDKWQECVPYLQIFCLSMSFNPVHSCNLQAINAMGRSDIFLKLEIIKKSIGLVALIIAVAMFDSPIAIAMTGVFTMFISCFVNAYPNKKLIEYSYLQQVKDYMPSFVASICMFVVVLLVGNLHMNDFLKLIVQIMVGAAFYVAVSLIFKLRGFTIVLESLKKLRK